MRPSLHSRFLDKAQSALISAIEVYNKPAFDYREEMFAILATNAWELLLKARVLQLNNNKVNAIRVFTYRQTKGGGTSRKRVLKRNRSGTAMTVGLHECMNLLDGRPAATLLRRNIEALIEIRDGAVHYIHASAPLSHQVLTVAAASIKNFIQLCKDWFSSDISKRISLMLPLAFITATEPLESVVVSREESKLIAYLAGLVADDTEDTERFSVAVNVEVKFNKSRLESAVKVQVSNEPGAVKVTLTEEDIRQRYPWTFDMLTQRLRDRYRDFGQNDKYHSLRRLLVTDDRWARERMLDPGNSRSSRKMFYSPNIVTEFDKHYQKRNDAG